MKAAHHAGRPSDPEVSPVCRYLDYRLGPDAVHKYAPDVLYWHVLAARLIFVLIFEVSHGRQAKRQARDFEAEGVETPRLGIGVEDKAGL